MKIIRTTPRKFSTPDLCPVELGETDQRHAIRIVASNAKDYPEQKTVNVSWRRVPGSARLRWIGGEWAPDETRIEAVQQACLDRKLVFGERRESEPKFATIQQTLLKFHAPYPAAEAEVKFSPECAQAYQYHKMIEQLPMLVGWLFLAVAAFIAIPTIVNALVRLTIPSLRFVMIAVMRALLPGVIALTALIIAFPLVMRFLKQYVHDNVDQVAINARETARNAFQIRQLDYETVEIRIAEDQYAEAFARLNDLEFEDLVEDIDADQLDTDQVRHTH